MQGVLWGLKSVFFTVPKLSPWSIPRENLWTAGKCAYAQHLTYKDSLYGRVDCWNRYGDTFVTLILDRELTYGSL
jgi:hypothetical protein